MFSSRKLVAELILEVYYGCTLIILVVKLVVTGRIDVSAPCQVLIGPATDQIRLSSPDEFGSSIR
jgi:hypothetical protein